MDILTGEGTKAISASGPMNQQPANMDSGAQPTYGNDQSDEECPRYMLAGTLTCVNSV